MQGGQIRWSHPRVPFQPFAIGKSSIEACRIEWRGRESAYRGVINFARRQIESDGWGSERSIAISYFFLGRTLNDGASRLEENEEEERAPRGGGVGGGSQGNAGIPDKWDHVVAIVHGEKSVFRSIAVTYRSFPPTIPLPPPRDGRLTISCFLKSLPKWVTRYFHREDRSSVRRGKFYPIPSPLHPFAILVHPLTLPFTLWLAAGDY